METQKLELNVKHQNLEARRTFLQGSTDVCLKPITIAAVIVTGGIFGWWNTVNDPKDRIQGKIRDGRFNKLHSKAGINYTKYRVEVHDLFNSYITYMRQI